MKIHLIKCASMCPIGGMLPKAFLPHALTCNCLLIESSSGLVLVDTAIGKADMADPKRLGPMSYLLGLKTNIEDTALRQIVRLGFSPSDVTHIIPTHLDLDHAGGLPDFPNATVHVFRLERDAALSPGGLKQRERYRVCHWEHRPKWQTYDPDVGETWNGFKRVRELRGLPPEILLISLPGHTMGHAGISILTDSGWLLHAGDAYYDRHQMDKNPTITPGMSLFQRMAHENFRLALETKDRLRELALGDKNIRLICAHDADEKILNTPTDIFLGDGV